MQCDRCGATLSVHTQTCGICGLDNKTIIRNPIIRYIRRKTAGGNVLLLVYIALSAVLTLNSFLNNIDVIFFETEIYTLTNTHFIFASIHFGVSIALFALCVGLWYMKRWALIAYMAVIAASGVVFFFSGNILDYILHVVLTYFIWRNMWTEFV